MESIGFTVFLILTLSTWRIASALADDTQAGPWDMLHAIRFILGVRYDKEANAYGKNPMGEGVLCLWCNSVWIGGLLTVLFVGFGFMVVLFCLPLALSGGAIMVNKVIS